MPAVNINNYHEEAARLKNPILLDVRTPAEYREGHIPGSRNLPLQAIDNAEDMIDNKDASIFVYCHSGARSSRAAAMLNLMGYANVKNLGGIAAYTGRVER